MTDPKQPDEQLDPEEVEITDNSTGVAEEIPAKPSSEDADEGKDPGDTSAAQVV